MENEKERDIDQDQAVALSARVLYYRLERSGVAMQMSLKFRLQLPDDTHTHTHTHTHTPIHPPTHPPTHTHTQTHKHTHTHRLEAARETKNAQNGTVYCTLSSH